MESCSPGVAGCVCVLRGRCNTLEAGLNQRVGFSWPAAGAALCAAASRASVTQCQKSWQGQHFVSVLKIGVSFAKIINLSFVKI